MFETSSIRPWRRHVTEWLILAGVAGGWLLLQMVILPRLGVPT